MLYPSFALPLLEVSAEHVRKIYGYCRGLEVRLEDSGLVALHSDPKCIEYAKLVVGTWFDPWKHLNEVDEALRDVVEKLLDAYGWMGIATSPRDDVELFASIVLSRNTDYHTNVVRWMRRILEIGIGRFLEMGSDEVSKIVGRSYQIHQLREVLRNYLAIRDKLLQSGSLTVRRAIMEMKFLGPKTADAYLLFVKLDTSYAPIDRNLQTFVRMLGLENVLGNEVPTKQICLKYLDCDSCPHESCLLKGLRRYLGRMSGWFQTVAYVHAKIFCREKRCYECSLRSLCRARFSQS